MLYSVRQNRFVHQYILTGNAAEAARFAGYSERSSRQIGQRLLTKHDTKQQIILLQLEAQKRLEVERYDVVKGLQESFKTAKEQGDPSSMIAAMAELARLLGLYSRASEPNDDVSELSLARIQEMTEKELLELADGVEYSDMVDTADDWVVK